MKRLNFIREQLASQALAVCKTYLPNGRRNGQYWVVGDINGNPGRSLYVRLTGRAGKWTDSATGEHGDLLDIIAHAKGHRSFKDTLFEAERLLSLPCPVPSQTIQTDEPSNRTTTARRLFRAGQALNGTIANAYLESRGLYDCHRYDALRFHPKCFGRSAAGERYIYPALLAAITDLTGDITGVHRTWISTPPPSKAPIDEPRRSMGRMIGHGVRFGKAQDVVIVGEGLETVLSLRRLLPWIPAVAALTATHLSLLELPTTLHRLYVARDNDAAGYTAWEKLARRVHDVNVVLAPLIPDLKDWNDDLRINGFEATLQRVLRQLMVSDRP